jgi:preprotein translocase subunit Sss1
MATTIGIAAVGFTAYIVKIVSLPILNAIHA